MPNPRIEKDITIKSIFNKEGEPRFTIYDTEGNKYTGWKEWQGESTTEYNLLKFGNRNEAFKPGDKALIQFVRNGEYMNVKALYPHGTSPKPNRVEATRDEAPTSSQGRNFEQEAYVKCCSIWAAADIHHGSSIDGQIIGYIEKGVYYNLFQAIKKDGEKRFSPVRQAVENKNPNFFNNTDTGREFEHQVEEKPPIAAYENEDDIKIEDIPF